MDKTEILQNIIEDSKKFEFISDEVLKIQNYNNNEKIYINFIGLIEIMYEKLNEEDINRILLTDYEE